MRTITEKPLQENITIHDKGLILDQIIRTIYNVAPKQLEILRKYRIKLNKGLTK